MEQHALGVARDPDELPERLALLREPRRGGLGPGDDAADAEVRVPAEALLAASAEAGEAGHHVVARPQGRHVGAHRLDDAGALVPENDRAVQRNRPTPSTTCRSLWQTPVAAVRTRTSRPHGLSISTGLDGQRLVDLAERRLP